MRKPLFNMEMPDDVREALERVRIKLGCRSHGETVRKLIAENDPSWVNPSAVSSRIADSLRQAVAGESTARTFGPITPALGSRLKKTKP
jgi:hypothetical protein